MTTCPRCGQSIRPGTPACPYCGTRLAAPINAGPLAEDAGQPDWLRQLQANQPGASGGSQYGADPRGFTAPTAQAPVSPPFAPAAPAQPANGAGSFSVASLVSEDALPEWMRAAGGAPLGSAPLGGPQGGSWGVQAPSPAYVPSPQTPTYGQQPPVPGYGQQPQVSAYGQQPLAQAFDQQSTYTHIPAPVPSPMPQASPMLGQQTMGVSANALFDDGALPEWLRQASAGREMEQPPAGYGQSHAPQQGFGGYPQAPQMPQRPHIASPSAQPYGAPGGMPQQAPGGAFPSIEQAGGFQAGAGMGSNFGGQALIDPNALPSWLGGQSATPQGAGGSMAGGMSAQSLVDESALPQWLRAEPATPAQPTPTSISTSGSAPSWAAGAVADEPLPSWLNQVYIDANIPRSNPQPAATGWAPTSGGLGQAARPPVAGGNSGMLPASAFVDESALPEWLKSQGAPQTGRTAGIPGAAQPFAQPVSMGLEGAPGYASGYAPASAPLRSSQPVSGGMGDDGGAGAGTFAASDLIDPQALPSWVRGEEAAPSTSFSSTGGWTSKQPAMPAAGPRSATAGFQSTTGAFGSGGLSYEAAGHSGALAFGAGGQSGALSFDGGGNLHGPATGFAASDVLEEPNLPSWMQSMQQATGATAARGAPRHEPLTPPAERSRQGMSETFDYDAPRAREPRQDTNAARRRGPPIPARELPPWLAAGGANHGDAMNRGPQPQEDRGHGAPRMQHMQQPESQEWWPDEGNAEPQWTDWNDGQYAEGYDDFEQDQGRGTQRRGWRRFFGRK